MASAGQRDRLVTIQQVTDGLGASRFPTEGWTDLATAWMSKRDVHQTEQFQAAQVTAPIDTQWDMEYRADMDPELVDVAKSRRLVYQGRVFDIVGAAQSGRRDGIMLSTLAAGKAA
jgi:SPP1 family predicted phage head-tail adaptor